MKSLRLLTVAAVVLCSTGCLIGPKYQPRDLTVQSHWTTGESPALITGSAEVATAWWDLFEDPVLSQLVADALAENLDVEAAGLRVIQARSSKVRAKDLLFPIVRPEASYGRQYFSENVRPEVEVSRGGITVPPGAPPPPPIQLTRPEVSLADHIDVYSVGVNALWEPDIWGQTRRRMKSAGARYEASIAEYDSVVVLVAAEVASTYIQLRTVDARIDHLRENVEMLRRLVESASAAGAGEGDRSLASCLLADTEARLVDLHAARMEYENALCALLGKLPGSLTERLAPNSMIPAPPPSVAVGLPTDLLRRRPDVREAERLAAAQSERVGITKAGVYPSFKLLGTIGYAASESGDLFDSDSVTKGYGAGVSWNILLYPFIQEKARMEEARYQEAIVNLENTVIKAATEAETLLGAYLRSHERSRLLMESAEQANAASQGRLQNAEDRTEAFDGAFTALEYRVTQNDKYAEARGTHALQMVRLYAALGGGWEVQAGKPFVKESTKEDMRERTDWRSFGASSRINATR